jgi:hypothetical protein
VVPETHVVHPVYPDPPHWAHLAWEHPLGGGVDGGGCVGGCVGGEGVGVDPPWLFQYAMSTQLV